VVYATMCLPHSAQVATPPDSSQILPPFLDTDLTLSLRLSLART
jgi:hypothetical protein